MMPELKSKVWKTKFSTAPSLITDLRGQVFGRLKVVEFAYTKILGELVLRGYRGPYWLCVCSCGGKKIVEGAAMTKGAIRSCGCLNDESRRMGGRATTHGKSNTREYGIYKGMMARCKCKTNRKYYAYGGRGIKVCDRWLNSFEAFLEDVGPRPSSKHSIDRIDVDDDYKPDNCRWATAKEQSQNRRFCLSYRCPDYSNMTPEQIAKAGTEHAHQAALFCWANSVLEQYPMLRWMHAIPNGGLRNKVTASRLKAEGVKSGVSDVFLPWPVFFHSGGIEWCGLYIEMKKPGKGRVSSLQDDFMTYAQKSGYATRICETWEQARDDVLRYLPDPS